MSLDCSYQNDLALEVSRSKSAENVLTVLLNSESKTREDKDVKLNVKVDTEIADRRSADTAESKTRSDGDVAV